MGKASQGADRKAKEYSPVFAAENVVLGAKELGISSFIASIVANTGRWNVDLLVPNPKGFSVVHSLGEVPTAVWGVPVATSVDAQIVEITTATASACFLYATTASMTDARIVPTRIIALAP